MDFKTSHIAFIGQKGIPAEFIGTSGIEFYVEKHASDLMKENVVVDCYVRNWATPKNQKIYKGIHLIHIPTIKTKHLDATVHSFLSSIHVCCTKADTVWYQAIGPAFFSFIPKLFGKRIIVTIHALDWKRDKWGFFARRILRIAECIAVHSANEIVVVSQELQEYYLKQYNKKSRIDILNIEPLPKIKPNIIGKKYGLKGNDYILYMGRFVPEKRIEWLIEAYEQIHPEGIKLVLSGGSSNTDIYENRLRSLAINNDNIIFTGYVFGREKQELLTNCRLFVLPSSLEGNPVILKEVQKKVTILISDIINSAVRINNIRYSFNMTDKDDFIKTMKKAMQYKKD